MKIIELKKDNLEETIRLAKKALENDELVVIPSDTIYVLAAKATSSVAVKKVLDFKGRRFNKGISIFLKNFGEIKKYAYCDKNQERIVKTLLPGLFTIILRSKAKTAPELEPGDSTIGIRVIEQDFVKRLLSAVNFPVTATSANISGKGPHYSVTSFLNTLSEKKKEVLDWIIDAGQLPKLPVSTVVRLTTEEIKILRKGVLNPKLILKQKTNSETGTENLAQKIYERFLKKHLKNKAVVIILRGDLGAGKTVFARGIGEIFNQQFFSPTFILLDEHPINQAPVKNIYHLDLFRLETEEEVRQLNLEKFLKKGNLLLIEWGEKLSTFQKLKNKETAFFFLQIEGQRKNTREFKLYEL